MKSSSNRVGRFRWYLMAGIIFPITFIMSLDRTNMNVSAPIIQQHFHFTTGEMTWILTSFSWTYALFNIPAGIFAERSGSRRGLTIADVWWSLWTFMTALGGSVATFIGIRALLGVGQAADWPASVNSIKRWFPKHERARANSILLGGLYLGPIIGSPLTIAIVNGLGWRWSFYIYAIAGAIMGVLWWIFYRDNPREHPRLSQDEVNLIELGDDAQQTRDKAGWKDWKMFMSNYRFWAFGLQYFFVILVQGFYTIWLPTYLANERHFKLSSMGLASSLPWVALFIMVFLMGGIQDRVFIRTNSKWKARVPFAITGFILAAGFLALGSQITAAWLMMVCFMISLGSVGMVQVAIWSTCSDLGGRMTGSVTGWTNFWGNLSGALGPTITGAIVATTGNWSVPLIILAVGAVVGALLWIFVNPDKPLEISQPPMGVAPEMSVTNN